jgi:hypothetical protein
MTSRKKIADQVADRAGHRCEYCKMHQALQGSTFHVEHILPEALGGPTNLDNLAFACPSCNLHKSNRTDAEDSESAAIAPLFHPRQQVWTEHFRWQDKIIEGLTPTGRATIAALQINSPRHLLIRQAEEFFELP